MTLWKFYRMDLKRRFSISCQKWTDKKIETYESKREWIEAVDLPNVIKRRKLTRKEEIMGVNPREQTLFTLGRIGRILKYRGEFTKYMEEKRLEYEILSQRYVRERADILGPELAVANFIISRGGSVKFWRDPEWYDRNNPRTRFPRIYVPGYFVEGIDASGTNLRQEGVESIRDLKRLKWLSLKGLTNLDDFALDFISGHYGHSLRYLNLTGCTGITHYGLGCFYRFEKLKVLNVTGIEHPPEFKLSCMMIQDLLPDLLIKGLNYSEYTDLEGKDDTIKDIQTEDADHAAVKS